MKTSSDCRSGELIQHGLSVAQVGRPKTFGKPFARPGRGGRAPAQVRLPHRVWATISALIAIATISASVNPVTGGGPPGRSTVDGRPGRNRPRPDDNFGFYSLSSGAPPLTRGGKSMSGDRPAPAAATWSGYRRCSVQTPNLPPDSPPPSCPPTGFRDRSAYQAP